MQTKLVCFLVATYCLFQPTSSFSTDAYDFEKPISPRSPRAIQDLYDEANKGDSTSAQCNLARRHEEGEGVEGDILEAINYYKMAKTSQIAIRKVQVLSLEVLREAEDKIHCIILSDITYEKKREEIEELWDTIESVIENLNGNNQPIVTNSAEDYATIAAFFHAYKGLREKVLDAAIRNLISGPEEISSEDERG